MSLVLISDGVVVYSSESPVANLQTGLFSNGTYKTNASRPLLVIFRFEVQAPAPVTHYNFEFNIKTRSPSMVVITVSKFQDYIDTTATLNAYVNKSTICAVIPAGWDYSLNYTDSDANLTLGGSVVQMIEL